MSIRVCLFLAVAILAAPTAAHAQWRALGPSGGPVLSLALDAQRPTTLYAGSGQAGVLVSSDGGATWRSDPLPVPGLAVHALAAVPGREGVVLAATERGLLRRRGPQGGWDDISGAMGPRPVLALALDPFEPETIYAGTLDAGVHKSVDGGKSWSAINQGLRYPAIRALAADPRTPGTLYAGTFAGGVFRSGDGGKSWKAVNKGMGSFVTQALAIDGAGGAVFAAAAGSRGGVFRTTDGGENWTRLNVDAANAIAVTADPARAEIVWIGDLHRGLFRSEDGGATWKPAEGWPRGLGARSIVATGTGALVASGNGLWTVGDTVKPAPSPGLGRFLDIAAAPGAASRAVAVGLDGVFVTADRGSTWQRLPDAPGAVRAAAIDAGDPRLVWLAGEAGLFRSADGAAPAAVRVPAEAGAVHAVASLGGKGERLLIAALAGPFVSGDGGRTWSAVPNAARARSVAVSGAERNLVAMVAGETILASLDAGATWRRFAPPDGAVVQIAVLAGPRLLAGTPDGLLALDDDGKNWRPIALPAAADVRAIAVDPRDPARLAIGTSRSGAWISRDGGASWSPLRDIEHPNIPALAVGADGALWAATFGRGVFLGAW